MFLIKEDTDICPLRYSTIYREQELVFQIIKMYFQIIKYIIQGERSKETINRSIRIDECEVDVLEQRIKKKKHKIDQKRNLALQVMVIYYELRSIINFIV